MSPLLILHLIIFSVFNIATVVSDGASGSQDSRLVKGALAKRGEYKYMVYVSEKMPDDPGSHFSAFLISNTYVMADVSPLALKHAGKPELESITYEIEADKLLPDSKGEQVVQATGKDVKIHPSVLDPTGCEFKEEGKLCYECPKKLSAMIIKVGKPFSFSDNVGSIAILTDCVPKDTEHSHSLIVGYGAYKPSGSSPTTNALGSIPGMIGAEQVCEKLHSKETSKTWKSNICFNGNNPNTCDSDISGLIMHITSSEDVAYGVITASTCPTGTFLVGAGFGAMEKWVRFATENSPDIAYRTWDDIIRKDATTVEGGTSTEPTDGTPSSESPSPGTSDGTPPPGSETTPTGEGTDTWPTGSPTWPPGSSTGPTGSPTWPTGSPTWPTVSETWPTGTDGGNWTSPTGTDGGNWTSPTGTDETPLTEPTEQPPPNPECPPCPVCPSPRGSDEKKSTGTKQSLFQFKFVIVIIYFLL